MLAGKIQPGAPLPMRRSPHPSPTPNKNQSCSPLPSLRLNGPVREPPCSPQKASLCEQYIFSYPLGVCVAPSVLTSKPAGVAWAEVDSTIHGVTANTLFVVVVLGVLHPHLLPPPIPMSSSLMALYYFFPELLIFIFIYFFH